MQEEVGLEVVTDGEFRRRSWQGDFVFALAGITRVEGELSFPATFRRQTGETFVPDQGGLRVTGPIGLPRTIFAEDFASLAATAQSALPKQTIPSPNMIYLRAGRAGIAERVYPDLEAFWADLAAAEIASREASPHVGCRYLQIDDVSLAMLNDPELRRQLDARGDDADRLHLELVQRLNEVLAGRPKDMAITTHLCRGNFRSAWAAEGSYDFVAEAVFAELEVDGFFLEYDDERSGGFEALRFVPRGRMVVLGLVTSKRGELEPRDDLKRRIEEASRYVPLDQLCLSPQCGFASNIAGNDITDEQQWAKLRLVVETAEEVWV